MEVVSAHRGAGPTLPETMWRPGNALHRSNGHAWIGGFLELVDWCQGFWFSLEVKPEWAPWDLGLGPR